MSSASVAVGGLVLLVSRARGVFVGSSRCLFAIECGRFNTIDILW